MIMCWSLTGIGQDNGFGLKMGGSMVFVALDSWDDQSSALGFNAGAYYHYSLHEGVRLQGELLYAQEGYEVVNAIQSTNVMTRFLDMNLVPKYFWKDALFVEGLIGYGIALSTAYEIVYRSGETVKGDEGFDDALHFGLGIGYEFKNAFCLNMRWQHRLVERGDWNNLQLGAAYTF